MQEYETDPERRENEKKRAGAGSWIVLILVWAAVAAAAAFLILTLLGRNPKPAEPSAVPSDSSAVSEEKSGSSGAVTAELQSSEAPTEEAPSTELPTTEAPTTEPPTTEAPTKPLPEPIGDEVTGPADVTAKIAKYGTVYIADGCGYGGYWFGETQSARYCEYVSRLAKNLEGTAAVYDVICPLAAGVNLSDETRQSVGLSDERAAIRWMCERMDPAVRNVPVWGALKSRNDEYLYFRTDHHWTALGAYYAYREFCAAKGIRPHELDAFQTYVFEGYIGSLYNYSNKNQSLKSRPDTVTAYIPNGTNEMSCYIPNNSGGGYGKYSWPIVKDVSSYGRGSYYLTFVAGDQPYNYAHNETITDGSSVLIVKDSYGNAFIPFLVDHYEHIYWIDYRSYADWAAWAGKADASISALVAEKGIRDVILCNNISSTGSKTLLNAMDKLFR